jgi:hypothetical protein
LRPILERYFVLILVPDQLLSGINGAYHCCFYTKSVFAVSSALST